jgi:PKD repeat protein
VSLDGRTSTDPDGDLIEFNWRFGDGTGPVNSPTGVYTYQQPGTYKISLTVVDDDGGESTDEFDLLVE